MLDEATQSTDVTSDSSPVAAEASTSETAPSVGQSGEQTQERSGDDTAQSASLEASTVKEGETTPPPSAEDDPLKDIPSTDELERLVEQRVPHAQAVLQLRKALEARNSELNELRGKASSAEPVLPLVEQYGGADTVKSRLETFDSLFSPVINPATNQPEVDPTTGFPRVTATPFIERVDAENPGMAEQILFDALRYQADFGTGQKMALHQHPEVQKVLLQACGLDPQRADDYRNIDALSAPQDTGVTPEDLTKVPAEFHDVFKALPPGVRNDLLMQDEATRQFNLEVHKERFDNKAATAAREQQAQVERQQAEANARAYVAREQDSFVEQQLQESYAAIMDDLARQVTFAGDEVQQAAALDAVGAYLLALRDPASSFAVTKSLEKLGVKIDPTFHEAVANADKHFRDAKAYELMGHKGFAQQSLTQAQNAKKQAMAKSSLVAVKIAQALGAIQAAKAARQNGALDDATRTRPVPGDGGGTEEGGSVLPAGMLPTDPRAGIYIARQTGLLGG